MYKGITAHNRKALQLQREQEHIKKLQEMGYKYSSLTALRRVENRISHYSVLACNGKIDDDTYTRECIKAHDDVKRLFRRDIIDGFFINQDPRGYALKIADNSNTHPVTFTDWGGYKILAPDRSNF